MGVIIRQSIKGTIANYVGIAVGFITTFFVLTHYLTAEQVGLTRVLVDAAVLFSSLAQLGTSSSTVRFYPYFKDDDRNHGLFFWTLIIPFVGFLIFLLCFFLLKGLIVSAFSDNSALFVNYVYFVLPISFFMLYTSVFEVNATILTRVAVPKFIREVVIRVLLLIGYVMFGVGLLSLDGLVVVFCATYAIAALLNFVYLLSTQRISFKPEWKYITPQLRREFLFYTLFLVTTALVSSVMPTLSSFFISAQMGLMFTGVFAIANYIATVIEVPYRSLSAVVQPQLSVAIKEGDIAKANTLCKKVALHQLLAGAVIFFIIWVNIDLFFSILPNGDQYATGKWVVLILSCTRLLMSTFSIMSSALTYSKYYYYSLIFTTLMMASSIALNYFLIPIWGINGAAIATFASYALSFVMILTFVHFKVGITPFSFGFLKVLILVAAMYLLNAACAFAGSRLLVAPSMLMGVVEAGVRTAFVCLVGAFLLYRWRISLEINRMIDKVMDRVKSVGRRR